MAFVIALSHRADLSETAAAAARGERPRHAMVQLADALGAELVSPGDAPGTRLDRWRSRLAGSPPQWAMARELAARLGPGDVIYCPDEGAGFPVASLCGGRRNGPRVIVTVHNIDRPRARLAMRLLGMGRADAFVTVSERQTAALRRDLKVGDDRLLTLCDQTDLGFFRPAAVERDGRPVVMSIGLEKRDYRTLAAATADMDLDVRISGFSRDAQVVAAAFPPEMPANMSRRFYDWDELLWLYRRADVVAVSLYENSYAAGIQALLEGIACERPVVVTRTTGLAEYLDRPDLVTTVPVGDAAAMRAAIAAKLADPVAAAAQAKAARDHYRDRIDSDRYVAQIAGLARRLARQ